MNKKLLLFVIYFLTFSFANAQLNSVAIVGSGTPNGWPSGAAGEIDFHQMTTTDGETWTLNGLVLTAGSVKFRGNNSWAAPYNWGGTGFPTGIPGPLDITSSLGVFNVTFNSTTFEYTFERQGFPVIGIIGTGTPGGLATDTDMETVDGITYSLTNVALTPGTLKFRAGHAWTVNWGGTFPSGTGVVDGADLTIPAAGLYNITFNKTSHQYNISFQVISIIGGPTDADWAIDRDMTTTDGKIYTLNNVSLSGAIKFRADHSWNINWGGTAVSGTASSMGGNIAIPAAGLYNITFNKTTLEYSIFRVVSVIGNTTIGQAWGTDVDMTTVDGNIYTLKNISLTEGWVEFRTDHEWASTNNWGGTTFPSGIGLPDMYASSIPIPTAGDYNVTFNLTTFAYNFTLNTLGVKDFGKIAFKAYPNPTQSNWTFNSSQENIESIVIVNISGQTLKTVAPKSNQANIDASDLTAGVYFAKVSTAAATQTLKLIKQ